MKLTPVSSNRQSAIVNPQSEILPAVRLAGCNLQFELSASCRGRNQKSPMKSASKKLDS